MVMAQYRLRIGASGPPNPLPAWLEGKELNTWYRLTGVPSFGGQAAQYGGITIKDSKILYFTSSGHGYGYNNLVLELDLSAPAPAWTTLHPGSSVFRPGYAYYADGLPAGRHTYDSTFYLPTLNKLLVTGFRFGYDGGGSGYTGPEVDAFDLSTNTWDGIVAGSPGTSGSGYANIPANNTTGAVMDSAGDIWTNGLGYRYSVSGNSWTTAPVTNTHIGRYPICLDSTRNQLFGFCTLDGEGSDGSGTYTGYYTGILPSGATSTAGITLTSADGSLTTINTAIGVTGAPHSASYATMCYIPPIDKFWWMATGLANVYEITPTSGTTWDISALTTTGTAPSGVGIEALVGHMKFIPELNIVVCALDRYEDLYYRRVA